MSPTSNQIAGFGSCVSSLILSETLYTVLSSGIGFQVIPEQQQRA